VSIGAIEALRADPDAFVSIKIECDFHGAGLVDGQFMKAMSDIVCIAEIKAARDESKENGLLNLIAIARHAQLVSSSLFCAQIWDDGAGETTLVEDNDAAVRAP
jgi:hypothetical protein